MNQPFRVGIVGCGNIADNHFQSYSAISNVHVVGVCDVDLGRAQDFAAERGIAGAVQSVRELIELGIDALSVCTPHPTHEAVVTEAAAAGVHILCEKPVATDVASAQRMVAAAERHDVTFGVVFQRRFWPGALALRAAIDDGRLGQPMLGHCQVLLHRGTDYYNAAAWRGTWAADGGGVLMTQAIHYIDLLQWFMGDPVEVSAKAGTFVHGESIEVEDTAAALITFASGAIATLSATVAASPNLGSRIVVTGSSGATVNVSEYPEGSDAINDLWAVRGEERAIDVFQDGLTGDIPVAEVNAKLLPLHKLQVADFVDAVRSGRAPCVSGREAMKSLQIVAAVYESARTGLPVRIGKGSTEAQAFPHLNQVVASR
ncbi:Gfo/Idh/MocA family protein [Arthrobacter sp. 18067]|uniref:Gfo/Idh/MocA family protein n=1 Tax=Arthrobacter sp. 18067 TaxID=2681413 RepID=UPI00135732DD|nr:Gfo/Idh/MocA family oxidoreductase [Arthrobacter sp. 18067]